MQAVQRYLVDVGYGRGYLDDSGQNTSLDMAQEWTWNDALSLVLRLRKRGYVGAEAVPVNVTPPLPLTEISDGVVTRDCEGVA